MNLLSFTACLYAANVILEVFIVITRRTEGSFQVKMMFIRKVNETEKKAAASFDYYW